MSNRKLPPTEPVPTELIMVRQPWSNTVVMVMEDLDSYRLKDDDVRLYFRLIGIDESFGDRVLDLLRNFYCLHVDLANEITETLPRQTVNEAMRRFRKTERLPADAIFRS